MKRPAKKTKAQEICEQFNVPREILGKKDPGRKSKITKAEIAKFRKAEVEPLLFGLIEAESGKKLKPYQKSLIIALLEAYPDLPVSIAEDNPPFPTAAVKALRSRKR